MILQRMTWDQATILHAATANGFRALHIPPGTVRRWAHEHHIRAIGKAPGGAHLYLIDQVIATAEKCRR